MIKESIKEIPGRFYDADDKAWVVPLSSENVSLLGLLGVALDDSLLPCVQKEEAQHEEPIYPMPIKATPYQHQVRAFNFAMHQFIQDHEKACAFLMDMGTGKTITTIAVAGVLFQQGKIKRMLVVAPKSIVEVWRQEFDKFAAFPYSVVVLDGDSGKKADTIRHMSGSGLQVIVVNYESCWRLDNVIVKWQPNMIVCDESSKIKNPQAKCSKSLHKLGAMSKFNLILTGTPITNSPLDFFSQYKFLDERIFGSSFFRFRGQYAILGGYQNHQIVGYKHLAELVEKAHGVAYRIKIDEAVELPKFVEEIRPVKLEAKAQQIYDSIDKDSYAELMSGEVTVRNVLTRLLRLSQCTGGFIRNDAGDALQQISSAKLEALEDIIDSCMEERKKVVVFARFVPEIDAISAMLRKKKIAYALIKGDVKDRAEQVDEFQNNDEVRVFIGQLQTTGMGLTLTAGSVAVYYSLDFSYANYEQSRARVRRIGQQKRGVYIHLVCKDTIDETVMSALRKKADVSKLLVDDYKKILGGS
jgi:SNF2 family DNA or RNA helicase